ncbi:hypothetical protein THAPSDRAFT_24038 [Thalassiosira pseudonana CCMP1335]|uniref:SET domain-containing protein n=1 Tax=Thalassiosira pseudonana TaxID=35128 RepID=B8C8H4_THAPS|nr:hypothetical protein THAPSDRAFT_24038 [Thalassiosira pseudonana CCMP1335]EED90288.1 hypothetical protein THAPSDRAFT_24038 [Thalassiosira pseudonana CCMP1335]|eukprot:scaffold14388_cov186-Alexandrium_tamarense.AAC.8
MSDPIDSLLRQATEYAQKLATQTDDIDDDGNDDDDDELDLTYPNPSTLATIQSDKLMEVQDDDTKGRGFYALKDLKAGTRLVVAKPLAMVMGSELEALEDMDGGDEEEEDLDSDDGNEVDGKPTPTAKATKTPESDDDGSDTGEIEATGTKQNGIIILRLLQKLSADPSLWTDQLSTLFPRDEESALDLPTWLCSDVMIGMEIERQFNELPLLNLFKDNNESICKEIQLRLPLVVRYNVLSMETAPELFVHPDVENGGMSELSGTGLYGSEVSYFNHSCVPNVSRYCIGDVMFFVTNRSVKKGDELCFSYIEHEFLCESAEKRTLLLDMNFTDSDDGGKERPNKRQKTAAGTASVKGSDDDIPLPLIDVDMQSELMATPLMERLELIEELLEPEEPLDPEQDYKCDKYQLTILHAITLDGLGRTSDALKEWESCVDFATKYFPPLDETTVALNVQAALCAHKDGKADIAKGHAKKAMEMHDALFGGGVERFRNRYEKEFLVKMRHRTEKEIASDVESLFSKMS